MLNPKGYSDLIFSALLDDERVPPGAGLLLRCLHLQNGRMVPVFKHKLDLLNNHASLIVGRGDVV